MTSKYKKWTKKKVLSSGGSKKPSANFIDYLVTLNSFILLVLRIKISNITNSFTSNSKFDSSVNLLEVTIKPKFDNQRVSKTKNDNLEKDELTETLWTIPLMYII